METSELRTSPVDTAMNLESAVETTDYTDFTDYE
jgi:hypothetical protein